MSSQPNGSSSTSSSASDIAKAAKQAFEASQLIPSSERINALNGIKRELDVSKQDILAANRDDLEVRVAYLVILQCLLTGAT
jgi:glutamate-5-semialdehyde dehydrogenase